jgi:hypothetical protein
MYHRNLSLLLLWVFLPSLIEAGELDHTVKVLKMAPPAELKKSIARELSDEVVQIADSQGNVWATFWFRKTIPSNAAPEQVKNGLTYREIAPTTLIGAVQFTKPWGDFRKQEIAPGVYTLRIAIQPMDGDHQGTAPTNDFCLLVPAANDEAPGLLEVKTLHELSANASGSTHPAVMLLFPNDKPDDTPKIISKPGKIVALNVKRPVDANGTPTQLGFSFVILGHTAD